MIEPLASPRTQINWYGRGETVTCGYPYRHRNCKRRVIAVNENVLMSSGREVELSACLRCEDAAPAQKVDMNWVKR